MAIGGKLAFPDDASETPDTLTTVYDFGNFNLIWEQFMAMGTSPYLEESGEPGVAFIGENGILAVNRCQLESIAITARWKISYGGDSPKKKSCQWIGCPYQATFMSVLKAEKTPTVPLKWAGMRHSSPIWEISPIEPVKNWNGMPAKVVY